MAIQDIDKVSSGQSLKDISELSSVYVACQNLPYCDLHVAKFADSTKAAPFLPEVAYGLIPHCCLTVSEWATVTLQEKWYETSH